MISFGIEGKISHPVCHPEVKQLDESEHALFFSFVIRTGGWTQTCSQLEAVLALGLPISSRKSSGVPAC